MKKLLTATAIGGLLIVPALAASAVVESAIKTFEQVGADPAKLKTFCEMTATMDSAGDSDDDAAMEALDKKIEGYMTALGPDMQKALDAGGDLDPEGEDGSAYDAALDKLEGKCS